MAVTADTALNGRGRTSVARIVLAGDRTVSRKLARRHSKTVKILKIALPFSAVCTVAIFAVALMKYQTIGNSLPDLKMPEVVADNLKMKNPHYEGYNNDGGKYWVKADTAQQDLKSLSVIRLQGITGELTDANKQKTVLTAARGLFDSQANDLELYEAIDVKGDTGLSAKLTRASVKTKEAIITSNEPVEVAMQAGTITSNQMTIRQKTKEYTFVDSVKMRVTPKEAEASEQAEARADLPFGKPGKPIDISANRLDINDEDKSALFTGGVTANQEGATLNAPEMAITYAGDVGQNAEQGHGASQGQLKQIVAREAVTMQQPSGESATCHVATFDAENHTVVLEGDVVLSQGADKRAVGDRAEYDQTAQTMVLTGPVVVNQGGNELKGRKLVFDRVTGKVQMTAASPGAAGRVTARFIKPNAKAAKPSEESDETAGAGSDGIPFGQAFKTDPSAPVAVTAEKLDIDDKAKTAVFTGDVRAQQGDFTISAQELTANYTGNVGLANAAAGAPTAANQKSPAAQITNITARKKVLVTSKDGQKAVGDWATVDVKANTATLGGAVTLTQGRNVVKGTKLLIDMNTGESTIKTEPTTTSEGAAMISSSDGDGSGQINKSERPSAVFYPNQFIGEQHKGKKSKTTGGWQAQPSP